MEATATKTNYDEKEEKLKSCVFFVEANSFETLQLWKEHKDEVSWEEDNSGFSQHIGNISITDDPKRQVHVSFMFAKIYGQRICFFDVISRYSDSKMVRDFLTKNYPVKWDNGRREAITDAQNFHHAIQACKEIFHIQKITT